MKKEWMPIVGTKKDTLIQVALEEFSDKGFEGVNISELATKADMTTGAVYHHFGSKLTLYTVVRREMEQRIIDRMEGAAALFTKTEEAMKAALLSGLVFSAKQNMCRLMGEEQPLGMEDPIKDFLAELNIQGELPIEIVSLSVWRSILMQMADGQLTMDQGKQLIEWLFR